MTEQFLQRILTRQQIRVCAAYWFEGMTQDQIGRRYGATQASVSRKIARAAKKIKEATGLDVHPPSRRRVVVRFRQLTSRVAN